MWGEWTALIALLLIFFIDEMERQATNEESEFGVSEMESNKKEREESK